MLSMLEKLLAMRKRYGIESETHDAEGREKVDPRPMEFPPGMRRPPTLQEELARILRGRELIAAAQARGLETLEDSMDFGPEDEGDDPLPVTVHEVRDMQEEFLRTDGAQAVQVDSARRARAAKSAAQQQPAKEHVPAKGVQPKPEESEGEQSADQK